LAGPPISDRLHSPHLPNSSNLAISQLFQTQKAVIRHMLDWFQVSIGISACP
jgi:hypothetical protein